MNCELWFSASCWEELKHHLAACDIYVPGRYEGRTSLHRERQDICVLLSSMGVNGQLDYPCKVFKRESPDFLLTTPTRCIGIEQVVGTNELEEKTHAWYERNPDFVRHEKSIGRVAEREWAQTMFDTVASKTRKLNEAHFESFSGNWLLIHDNKFWNGWKLHLDFAVECLVSQLSAQPKLRLRSDRLQILSAGKIISIELAEPIQVGTFEIYDLWEDCQKRETSSDELVKVGQN